MGTPVTLEHFIIHELWGIPFDKFSEYVDDIHIPDCVYHYTSRDKAVAITNTLIESGASQSDNPDLCGFAFSNYRFLNDSREYELGIKFALDWLQQFKSFSKELRGELIGQLTDNKDKFAPYVLSFCRQRDSTPHWQIYTDAEGGYAIGLDVRMLKEEVDRYVRSVTKADEKSLFKDGTALTFMPCMYWPSECDWQSDGKFNEKLSEAIGLFFDGFSDIFWGGKGEDKQRECASWCAMRICQFASFVKSNDFRHEEEWRLALRPDLVADKDARIIAGTPRITPRKLNLGKCIREVVISPHGDKDRLRLLAEFQMTRAGIGVDIEDSKSTYNGR